MNWKELTHEILLDVAKFVSATPDTEYIVGIIQWNGKFVAAPVYQPSPFELVGDAAVTTGMSVMPQPPDGWKPVKLMQAMPVPKKNGVPDAGNMPILYFLMKPDGAGLGIPSRFGNGKIAWSHNEKIIDYIGTELALIGIVTLAEAKK